MEKAPGCSENSGRGVADCPLVAFSKLVSGISIAPLRRTLFIVRTDANKSHSEILVFV